MRRCSTCGRFMALETIVTWEIDRYVPDHVWVCHGSACTATRIGEELWAMAGGPYR